MKQSLARPNRQGCPGVKYSTAVHLRAFLQSQDKTCELKHNGSRAHAMIGDHHEGEAALRYRLGLIVGFTVAFGGTLLSTISLSLADDKIERVQSIPCRRCRSRE